MKTTRAQKPKKATSTPHPDHHAVVAHYVQAFAAAKGTKPTFGGREAKSVSTLLAKVKTGIEACRRIDNAYSSPFGSPTIHTIAADPDKYVTEMRKTNAVQPAARPGEQSWEAREL